MNSKSNRVFGFVRRNLTMLLVPVVVLLAGTVWQLYSEIESGPRRTAVASAERAATRTIEQFKWLRGYYAKNVVGKVKRHSDVKVSYDHATSDESIPLPATLIHDLSEHTQTIDGGLQIRLYSRYPYPNRSRRSLDEFAERALDAVEENPEDPYIEAVMKAGQEHVRVAVADRMQSQSCVSCHNYRSDSPKTDWKLGDVRGVLEVTSPIGAEITESNARAAGVLRYVMMSLGLLVILVGGLGWILWSTKKTAKRIRSGVDRLLGSSNELVEINNGMNDAFEVTARDAAAASASSSEVNGHLQTIATAVDELGSSVGEISSNANNAAQIATSAVDSTRSSGEAISRLGDSSQEIGKVIQVINSIAEQTNLLALNATIEAARAGEAGKGFAVVANEVKELAKETSNATDDITLKVQSIQSDAAGAVDAIGEVSDVIEQICELQQSIAGAVEEQSATSTEISRNLSSVSQGSNEIYDRISHVASATTRASEAARATLNTVRDVDDVVNDLSCVASEGSSDENETN